MSSEKVLVIACGATKHETPDGPVCAIDLYAGRQFEVARRMEVVGWTVLILSAEHGLLPSYRPIISYDRKMTSERAAEFAADDMQAYVLHTWTAEADTVVFYGGETYFRAFEALTERAGLTVIERGCDVVNIIGAGCGEHFSVLQEIARESGAVLGRSQ